MIRDDILKLSENSTKLPRIVPAIIKAIRKKIGEGITDSVKSEGPYRGGFTHTDSVKEDPDGT